MDSAWVDQVLYFPDVGLNKALDNDNLTFATSPAAPWMGQANKWAVNGSAARSAIIGDNASSWLETMVIGPGTLLFSWSVSSEHLFDRLEFGIDGTRLDQFSGVSFLGFSKKTFQIPSGVHLLRWTYAKDKWVSKGDDCGWLEKVSYIYHRTGASPDPAVLLLLDDQRPRGAESGEAME